MITLKDIKVSKNRIPVQNAIWLRPTGGLTFKIYYPHGGDWTEINFGGSSPSPTPTPSPSPSPSSYLRRTDCDGGRVIAGRCIPLNPRVGNRYFFADGRIKFKSNSFVGNSVNRRVYTFGYEGTQIVWSRFPGVPLLRKDNWKPIVVHIRSINYYNNHPGWCKRMVLEGKTIYYTQHAASDLTCDTTSPYFKVISGHLRNVAKPRMPKFCNTIEEAIRESKNFVARRLKYRSNKVRGTYIWDYAKPEFVDKVPITIRRWWKFISKTGFANMLKIKDTGIIDTTARHNKVILLKQIIRGRKSMNPIIIRRYSHALRSSRGGKFAYYKELEMIK